VSYKTILNTIAQVLQEDSWIAENVKKIYRIDLDPALISEFPAITIYPTTKTEAITTMPVIAAKGRFKEITYEVACYQKYMKAEVVRLGSETDLGLYDFVDKVEDILRAAIDLRGIVLWHETPATTLNLTPHGETAFLATGLISLVTKEKI